MEEIVGARIGGTYITNDPAKIQDAISKSAHVEFFDRNFARRMASIFPERWLSIAEGATLLVVGCDEAVSASNGSSTESAVSST